MRAGPVICSLADVLHDGNPDRRQNEKAMDAKLMGFGMAEGWRPFSG
jgi:hypothetical protein